MFQKEYLLTYMLQLFIFPCTRMMTLESTFNIGLEARTTFCSTMAFVCLPIAYFISLSSRTEVKDAASLNDIKTPVWIS